MSILINWDKVKGCPECGSNSIDIDSRDTIRASYYLYCLDCRHESEVAYQEGTNKEHQPVVDKAVENWNKND